MQDWIVVVWHPSLFSEKRTTDTIKDTSANVQSTMAFRNLQHKTKISQHSESKISQSTIQ